MALQCTVMVWVHVRLARALRANECSREEKKRRKTSEKMAEGATSLKGLRVQMGRNSSITRVFVEFARCKCKNQVSVTSPKCFVRFWMKASHFSGLRDVQIKGG